MSLYAISDLHLSFGTDKQMDIFGGRWENYINILSEKWHKKIKNEDVIILCGDNSWATYLEDALEDFKFINSLPGKKILSKGNHDYWWTTLKKMNSFCLENKLETISFLHNNSFLYKDIAICGARGWGSASNGADNEKIYNRETQRLKISLGAAKKLKPREIVAALHFPPDTCFRGILHDHDVNVCVYGHLHGKAHQNAINDTINGLKYRLVSCDFLQFNPLLLY